MSATFNHFKDPRANSNNPTDNPRCIRRGGSAERRARKRGRNVARPFERACKKQAARSSENDSIRGHINLLFVVFPGHAGVAGREREREDPFFLSTRSTDQETARALFLVPLVLPPPHPSSPTPSASPPISFSMPRISPEPWY